MPNGIVCGTVLCDRGKCNLVEVAHDACILHTPASFSMRNEAKNSDHYYKILKGFSWLCFKINFLFCTLLGANGILYDF